jgi:hypothetical protein
VSKQVPIEDGVQICPRGYVLVLDADSSPYIGAFGVARLGGCVFCSPGTYSINPLYGGSGPETGQILSSSKCLICPAAGTCLGGDQVKGQPIKMTNVSFKFLVLHMFEYIRLYILSFRYL